MRARARDLARLALAENEVDLVSRHHHVGQHPLARGFAGLGIEHDIGRHLDVLQRMEQELLDLAARRRRRRFRLRACACEP